MVFRAWMVLATVIGLVQATLALLSILQNDALLSDLLRRRLSVMAQNSASAYQPFVELGLPLSMVRNGNDILARAIAFDPDIAVIHTIDPSGAVVYSTNSQRPQRVAEDILHAMFLAQGPAWGLETEAGIFSGYEIRQAGTAIGAVVVGYPADLLAARSEAFHFRTMGAAIAIWIVFSALAWVFLRLSLARLQPLLASIGTPAAVPLAVQGSRLASLRKTITTLRSTISEAEAQFRIADRMLDDPSAWKAASERLPSGSPEPGASVAQSLAPGLALRLAPVAAFCIVGSALALAVVTYNAATTTARPEIHARIGLIGSLVGANVERAVAAGIPIDRLVGAEQYFGDLLQRFPEIAEITVRSANGKTILQASAESDIGFGARSERGSSAQSRVIVAGGETVGSVDVTSDPRFIAKRFRNVFLDTGVVALVSLLLSFEVMVLLSSRRLTAPLNRLQRLAAKQAAGDFSMQVVGSTWGAIGTLSHLLSERSAALQTRFREAMTKATDATRPSLLEIGQRFGLSGAKPGILRTTYFTNFRLALFLFAAADELHASFFVLYIRSSENPWTWLDTSVLLSLPFVGFQLTGFLVAPFSRRLSERYGSRSLLIVSVLPVIAGYIGISFSTSIPEIAVFRTLSGIGYALAVLACEDYVIDTSDPAERGRNLGAFSMVYFSGIFAGTALGGVLADRIGQAAVFLVGAAMVTVSLVLVLWLTRSRSPLPHVAAVKPAETSVPASWRGTFADRRLIVLLLGIVAPSQIVDQAYILLLMPLVLEGLGFEVADIARCLMLYCIAVAGVGNVTGHLARFGLTPFATAVLAQTLAGLAILCAATWQTPVLMIVTLVLVGIGFGLARWAAISIAVAIAERSASPSGAVRVLGMMRSFERIANVSTLFLVSALAGQIGYDATMASIGLVVLSGAGAFLLFVWSKTGVSLPR